MYIGMHVVNQPSKTTLLEQERADTPGEQVFNHAEKLTE